MTDSSAAAQDHPSWQATLETITYAFYENGSPTSAAVLNTLLTAAAQCPMVAPLPGSASVAVSNTPREAIDAIAVDIPSIPPPHSLSVKFDSLAPSAMELLLSLGPPLVTTRGRFGYVQVTLTPALCVEIEELKSRVRRSAHQRKGERRARSIEEAIAACRCSQQWYAEYRAGGTTAVAAAPVGVPPAVQSRHQECLHARMSSSMTLTLFQQLLSKHCQPILRVAAGQNIRLRRTAMTRHIHMHLDSGIDLTTPFMTALRLLLETQLVVSQSAHVDTPAIRPEGSTTTSLTFGQVPDVPLGIVLEDEIFSEVGADDCTWIVDCVTFLMLTLGISVTDFSPPLFHSEGKVDAVSGHTSRGGIRLWALPADMSNPLIAALLENTHTLLVRPTHTVHINHSTRGEGGGGNDAATAPPAWWLAAAAALQHGTPAPGHTTRQQHVPVAVYHFASLIAAQSAVGDASAATEEAVAVIRHLESGGIDVEYSETVARMIRLRYSRQATHHHDGRRSHTLPDAACPRLGGEGTLTLLAVVELAAPGLVVAASRELRCNVDGGRDRDQLRPALTWSSLATTTTRSGTGSAARLQPEGGMGVGVPEEGRAWWCVML